MTLTTSTGSRPHPPPVTAGTSSGTIAERQALPTSRGKPLAGIRILAVEHYGAGPFGTVHLADLGAEVIKIEERTSGGDMSRGVGPHHLGEADSTFYQPYNRNKR